MHIDIYDTTTFGRFLDSTVEKWVILEGRGLGVLGYTDDCTRIGDQRLIDLSAVTHSNCDWIDVSSVTKAHGLSPCLISRNFYARCVYNFDPGREHVNVGNLLHLLTPSLLGMRLHTWSQDLCAYGVGRVRVSLCEKGTLYVGLAQDAERWSRGDAVMKCVDKTFAPTDRACEMPYCLHE